MACCPNCGKDNSDKQGSCFWCGRDLSDTGVSDFKIPSTSFRKCENTKPERPDPRAEKLEFPVEKKTQQEPILWEEGEGGRRKLAYGAVAIGVIVVVATVGVYLMGRPSKPPSSSPTATSGWELVSSLPQVSLRSVYMLSSNDGWAVGMEWH